MSHLKRLIHLKPLFVACLASLLCGGNALAGEAVAALPVLYIAGDSTAAEGTDEARGWGRHLARHFDAARVRVENRARGGRSSRTFVTEGLWEQIRTQLKPGDVVLLQFGHNDGGSINDPRGRASLPGLGEESATVDNPATGQPEIVHTFGWYLRKMIAETRAQGAHPVLLSLTVRNLWTEGRVERGSGNYSTWSRQVADAADVMFIDVTNFAADLYERMGQPAVAQLFPRDHTHTSDAGALRNAEVVVQLFNGLREEAWSHWLSAAGRALPRAEPRYVRIASVRAERDGTARFLNVPQRAVASLPTLWLIGDSTVRTGRGRGEGGQFGWGDPLQNLFDLGRVNVVNRALGGTGARTFRTGGTWQPVLEQIRPGDVVLIQFGHNDNGSRGALPGSGERTESRTLEDGSTETVLTFGAYLRLFIGEVRSKGATPVLCSLVPRKTWVNGAIARTADGHAAWTREVAQAARVPFIDLHERVAQKYDALGATAVDPLFADAGVHTSFAGALLNAATVVEGLRALPDNPVRAWLTGNP